MQFRYVEKSRLKLVPQHPGVYALSQGKEILYIGKGANLRERIRNHFQRSSYRDNLFIDKTTRVGWIETLSDIDALLLESQLIKKYQPRYNVMWRDDKQYFYVGITKETLPRVFLTHQPFDFAERRRRTLSDEQSEESKGLRSAPLRASPKNVNYIGPFVDGKAIKQVLRLLRRAFPYYTLRRGSGQAAKKHPQLPCPWCHLDLCPGPRPDVKKYRQSIKHLVSVLRGRRISVLKNLKASMKQMSKEQDFERAAILRDQYSTLKRIMAHRLSVLGSLGISMLSQEYSEVEKKLQKLFGTKKRVLRIEAYDISNIQGKFSTGSMVTFLQGKPAKEWYRKFKIHYQHKVPGRSSTPRHGGLGARARQRQSVVSGPNEFAMMQELVTRRLRHNEWPYPDLMIIDGGKPQLTAALSALKKSKVKSDPFDKTQGHPERSRTDEKLKVYVAALAKRHNELFFPKRSKPLLLKNLPQEVANLLLHIRDEAHRFAITYHRKLRKKNFLGY